MRPATSPRQRPPEAKLLVIGPEGGMQHLPRARLAEVLGPGDLLVANDAATIPASLAGTHSPSGEVIEVRLAGRWSLARDDVRRFTAVVFGPGDHQMRTEDRPDPPVLRAGDALILGPLRATVVDVLGHPRLIALRFEGRPDDIWAGIARHGKPIQYAHVREHLALWDVWTRVAGRPVAFEAPSASFALDWRLLGSLSRGGVGFATLTHAAGISSTGDPALDARLPLDEAYHIPEATVGAIRRARAAGGRVVALGTSVTRALEHAASRPGGLRAGAGLATQRISAVSRRGIVHAIISGVHEPGTSHYELLRAFTERAILERATAVMERCGYRSHEFGDSVMVAGPVKRREGGLDGRSQDRRIA